MRFLPLAEHDHHDDGPKPGADDQECRTQIEKDVGLNRWIERVENRGLTQQQGNRGHQGAQGRHRKAGGRPLWVRERHLKAGGRHQVAKAHDEEGRENKGHQNPVGTDRGKINLGGLHQRNQAAALKDLIDTQHTGETKRSERQPEMAQDQGFK